MRVAEEKVEPTAPWPRARPGTYDAAVEELHAFALDRHRELVGVETEEAAGARQALAKVMKKARDMRGIKR